MNTYLTPFRWSNYVDVRVLAANVAEVHNVPSGATRVVFSANGDFYVRFNAAAAVPAADVTDGTGSILNPNMRTLDGVTTIGIISAAACNVTMEFYAS